MSEKINSEKRTNTNNIETNTSYDVHDTENRKNVDEYVFEVSVDELENVVPKRTLYRKQIVAFCGTLGVLLLLLTAATYKTQISKPQRDADVQFTDETTVATSSEVSDDEFMQAFMNAAETATDTQDSAVMPSVTYFEIDRTKLAEIENCIGYIDIAGTYISDWVVQAGDNDYYLDTDAYGNPAENGAVFGDYRNTFDTLNRNNIIYAHNMADGSRFGTLQRLADATFYKDAAGEYKPCDISFDTLCYNNIFRVYSVYEIDLKTFNYIRTTFENIGDFTDFVEQTRSYNSISCLDDENIPVHTKLLTLSTCTAGGTKRLVVHAYLYARGVV